MMTMTNLTTDELLDLGFTRQSKTMWRKGDVTYQNGKFYDKDKQVINDLPTDPQRAEEGERK